MPDVKLLPAPPPSAIYDHNYLASCERVTDHLAAPPPAPRQRSGASARGRSCWRPARSSGRWSSPATTGPASCWPARSRPMSRRYGVLPGRRAVVVTNNDGAYRTRARSGRGRRRGRRRSSICAPRSPRARCGRGRAPPASSVAGAAAIVGTGGEPRRRRHACDAAAPAARQPRRRSPATASPSSGGWSPAVHLFSQAGGKLRWDERASRAFLPGARPTARASRRRRRHGRLRPRRLPRRRPRRRRQAAARRRLRARRRRRARAEAGSEAAAARSGCCPPARRRPAREALRRLPERRDRRRRRARRARGLSLGRARQALHHARHGAPTRARPATSTRSPSWPRRTAAPIPQVGTTTFRPPYTPVTFGALAGERSRRPLRARPPHADA